MYTLQGIAGENVHKSWAPTGRFYGYISSLGFETIPFFGAADFFFLLVYFLVEVLLLYNAELVSVLYSGVNQL